MTLLMRQKNFRQQKINLFIKIKRTINKKGVALSATPFLLDKIELAEYNT